MRPCFANFHSFPNKANSGQRKRIPERGRRWANFPSLQLLPPKPHTFNYTPRSLLLPIHFQSHSMLTPSISFDRSLTQIQWPCHHIPHVFLDSSSACISRITTLKMFQALTENSLLGTGRCWVDRGLDSQSDRWKDKIRNVGGGRSIQIQIQIQISD